MGRVGRFILKVAAVLILIVSAGTIALFFFLGEAKNGENLQRQVGFLINGGILTNGGKKSWKEGNKAAFFVKFFKLKGPESVSGD